MTHIYLFCEGRRASIYGIGTYIQQLTEMLQQQNDFSLTIVQLTTDGEEFKVEESGGIRQIFCPKVQFAPSKHENKYYRNAWYLIRPYIQCTDNDRLIFHLNYYTEYPLIEKMKADFPDCRTIHVVHYMEWSFLLNGNLSYFKQIIRTNKSDLTDEIEKKTFESYEDEMKQFAAVDEIVCLSNHTKQLLIDKYHIPENKIRQIYNGLKNEAVYLSAQERAILKKQSGFEANEQIILFVGRLDEVKGLGFLISSFYHIITSFPDSRLVIAGDGFATQYMQKVEKSWGKVTFTGHLSKEKLYQLYQIADLGVVPSLYEELGYVAMEMMMFGLPFIATQTAGLNEIVEDGVNGWKIPVTETDKSTEISVEDLKGKIAEVLSGQKRLDKDVIRNSFLSKFELNTMYKNYSELYESKS